MQMQELAQEEDTWPLRLFSRLGIFILPNFLDAEVCTRLLIEVQDSGRVPATITRDGVEYLVDEEFRRSHRVQVSGATTRLVTERLRTLQPRLEEYFDLELTDLESPQFLQYLEGNYFRPHRDNASGSEHTEDRKISLVVFLNGSKNDGREYFGGGALTFYGLLAGERLQEYGVPLRGETGLLVAFHSNTFHEVEVVSRGERHTIASWYF